MKISIFQKGFNYSQDGPGNRLVYHLQGCNLRCPWCANPESIEMGRPRTAAGSVHDGAGSGFQELDVEKIMEEVLSSSPMFFDGGGVTFTGGEPTLQFGALQALLKALKSEGIHTAIETNATHSELERLFPLVDFLMMDFKHYDSDTHRKLTGSGNERIRENVARAFAIHPNVLVRIPLIKGVNASEADARSFVRFFLESGALAAACVAFEFLPYHEYGKVKWEQCGMAYEMDNAFIEPGTREMYERIFKENGLTAVRT